MEYLIEYLVMFWDGNTRSGRPHTHTNTKYRVGERDTHTNECMHVSFRIADAGILPIISWG